MKNIFLIASLLFANFFVNAQESKNDSIPQYQYDIVCSDDLEKEVDEFSGEVTYTAPVTTDVSFIKVINKKSIIYYLSLYVESSGIYPGKGVSILLKNGKKIIKPHEKVETSYISGSFYSKAFFRLNSKDIILLKQSGIKKFKLYISTGHIVNYSDRSKNLFNCLINAK